MHAPRGWRWGVVGSALALAALSLPVIGPQPAAAATIPADVQAMLDGLAQWGSFSQAFGTEGALGKQLPLVDMSPGSAEGLAFASTGPSDDGLIGDAVADTLKKVANAESGTVTLNELGSPTGTTYPVDLGDGRTGTLTVTGSGTPTSTEELAISLTMNRTVNDQPLDVQGSVGAQPVSLTSTGGVQVQLQAQVDFDAFVVPESGGSSYYFYIGHGGGLPSISVNAKSSIPDPSAVDASIGVLGVTFSAASFSDDENLTVSLDDPNEDGQLAFTNADGSTGELGQAGAATGLVHVGFASPAGSVTDSEADQGSSTPATFTVDPKPLQAGSTALPAVQLGVSWPDVSGGTPTITNPDGNLSQINDFLNMDTQDLANGVEHLATTVDAIQRSQWGSSSSPSGNFDLPYMKGTAADAVDASAALKAFVTQFTYGPDNPDPSFQSNDPAKLGKPTFASLQELIADFNRFSPGSTPTYPLPGDATITVGTMDFNDSTSGPNKLLIPLTIQAAAPASPVTLDVQPVLAQGSGAGVTYPSDSTLQDTAYQAISFSSDLVGQTVSVTVGGQHETAIIAGASGDVLTLKQQEQITSGSQYWVIPPASPGSQPVGGTTPSDGTAYKIVAPDPQTGELQLGNSLGDGIERANGATSDATVSPSYTVNVGLVLNLEPPVTGSSCEADASQFPQYPELSSSGCPFQHQNPDGSTTTIYSLPTNADRIEIRTGPVAGFSHFLTEDFPITSTAPSDLVAQVGYLQVHLSGSVDLNAPASGHMRTIDLVSQTAGDGSSDLTMDQIVHLLVQASTTSGNPLLDETDGGSLSGSIAADVPDSSTGSTPSYFGQTTLPQFGINWGDITTGSPAVTADPSLGELADFNYDTTTPTAVTSPLIKSLQVLDTSLSGLSGASTGLNATVPLVGKPIGSLVGGQDSGSGPNVTYTSDTLTDSARPFDSTADPKLAGRTVTVGTAMMTIASVAAAGAGTQFTFTQPFTTVPVTGTPYQLTSGLKDAIGALAAQPPPTLQAFLSQLDTILGDGSTATIGVDTSGPTPALVVNLNWKRTSQSESLLSTSVTPSCSSSPCPTAQSLVESQTSSPIQTSTTGEDSVGLEVPLAAGSGPSGPGDLQVTDGSRVMGNLTITGSDSSAPGATIGPLPVKLGASGDNLQVAGSYQVAVGTGSGSGTESLASFLGQVPSITSTGTSCSAASVTATALCAHIPVYNGVSNDGPVTVDIPASQTNVLDATGDITDSATGLGDDIKASEISFSSLLTGINNYFDTLEQGLSSASFGGKLPLIGNDLQEGSDFVGKVKGQFDGWANSFLSSIPTTAGALKTAIQNGIDSALGTETGVSVTATIACNAPLGPTSSAPNVTATNPDSGTTSQYEYEILSYSNAGGSQQVSTASPASAAVTNLQPLTSSDYDQVSWSSVDGADGYLVLQSTDSGTTWNEIASVSGGSTTSYKDDGSDPNYSANYPVPTQNPTVHYSNCPGSTGLQYIQKVSITVKAGGTVGPVPLPFDIGIPGLSLSSSDATNQPTASAHWNLDFTFGIDKDTGFFVAADGTTKVISVDAEVTSPSSFKGQVAFLDVNFQDKSSGLSCGSDTGLGSNVCIAADIVLSSPSGEITLSDLANPSSLASDIKAEVTGGVNIDWGFDVVPGSTVLPGISGDFVLKWNPSLSTSSGLQAGNLDVEFDNVQIDAGSFLSGILGPIVREVQSVTGPLQPVINTLTAPIPVLSQLSHLVGGGDVTLLSIAEAFNTVAGGPDLSLINRIVALTQLFEKLNSLNCSSGCSIPLGNYVISGGSGGDPQSLLDNPVNPVAGTDPSSIGQLPSSVPDVGSTLSSDAGSSGSNLFPSSSGGSQNKVTLNDNCAPSSTTGTSKTESAGLTFPVVEHPLNIFRLLMGQDISLACFDSGVLSIGFSYSQSFGPVYAPPPVLITISGSASASLHIVGGFDTYGIRTAAEDIANGTATPGTALTILDSL